MIVRDSTRHVVARHRASSMQSLLSSTALLRLCRAGVLGLALTSALFASPAFADGGAGGPAAGGPTSSGGADEAIGPGHDGDPNDPLTGNAAGGGGAGETGGAGGAGGAGGTVAAGGPVAGADGADGANSSMSAEGGGGGGGGAHGWVGSTLPAVAKAGGKGGTGGGGTAFGPAGGGGGGAGGWGAVMNGAPGWAGTVNVNATGGQGGDGGSAAYPSSYGGGGGSGGTGFYAVNSGTLTTDSAVKGGLGGNGGGAGFGAGGVGGTGGAGGAGIVMNGGTVTVNGTVTGGNGGDGGIAANVASDGGAGGDAGAGIVMNGGGTVTVSSGATVAGGNGGAGGANTAGGTVGAIGLSGAGITGANLTVINAGSIAGGNGSSGQANAVTFTGGANVYEMWVGSSTSGNVVDASGNGGTFRLGGNGGAFDASELSAVGGASQYQGFKHLEKTGTGTWVLTGNSTSVDDITVNSGLLQVNGSLGSVAQTTVNNGGLLFGNGTLGAVQVNAGGVFLSGNTPGQSMTVASLAFASSAFYRANLNQTTSSFANVTGTASLGGATVQAAFAGGGGYIEKQYKILTAGNVLTDTFNPTVSNIGLPSGFKTSLSYDANNVYLDLALNILPPSTNGLNRNQTNVANAVTHFFNTTGSIPIAFGALTPNGLTQASGELGTAPQQTTFQAMNMFMGLITDPFSAGRGGANNGPTAFADESESMAYAGRAKSKAPRDAFAAFTKAPQAAFAQRWNVWAAGYGGSQTTDGNAAVGSNATTSAIYGAAVGADYWFSPDTVAGFALAGAGSNFSVANGGSGRSDIFQAGAFVRHNFGATYLTAAAAYGWQDVTTDRYVSVAGVDHLRANFNANTYSGRLELGHRFLTPWFGGLGVSPYAAAQITAFELPSYAERAVSGASTFALNYGADTATSSRTELGLRTDKSYALDGAVLTLRGRAAWAHDFNPDRAIAATFQTLPGASFVVNGAALASDTALTTASAELRWLNGWSVAATFEGEFSDVTRSYAGKGVVRYNW
ncbi:uncharacterized protein with beta-barrel porin domain [Nitrobacteraceae bacterium AZCC 1564]